MTVVTEGARHEDDRHAVGQPRPCMTVTTTLSRIRAAGACAGRYGHLCKSLGGIYEDTTINLLQILEHNGEDDMTWALVTPGVVFEESAREKYINSRDRELNEYWSVRSSEDYRRDLAIAAAWSEYENKKKEAMDEFYRVRSLAMEEHARVVTPAMEKCEAARKRALMDTVSPEGLSRELV